VNLESVDVDALLLALKIAFLVLLYLFIWRIVRTASRDVVSPQESFVHRPSPAPAPEPPVVGGPGRLVVLESPALTIGEGHELDSQPLTIGRSSRNDLHLRGDRYASARHARVEPREDGVWVVDAGSTNGTFVNGVRLDGAKRLSPGDVLRVGETDLRYER
jgi:hypothetical protein